MEQLKLFTMTTCPHCKVLKKYLISNDIDFIEINTDEDENGQAELIAENIWSVPTIKYDEKYFVISSIDDFKRVFK